MDKIDKTIEVLEKPTFLLTGELKDSRRTLDYAISILKRVKDRDGMEDGIHLFFGDNITWKHIDFQDDFPYVEIMDKIEKDLATSLQAYLLGGE